MRARSALRLRLPAPAPAALPTLPTLPTFLAAGTLLAAASGLALWSVLAAAPPAGCLSLPRPSAVTRVRVMAAVVSVGAAGRRGGAWGRGGRPGRGAVTPGFSPRRERRVRGPPRSRARHDPSVKARHRTGAGRTPLHHPPRQSVRRLRAGQALLCARRCTRGWCLRVCGCVHWRMRAVWVLCARHVIVIFPHPRVSALSCNAAVLLGECCSVLLGVCVWSPQAGTSRRAGGGGGGGTGAACCAGPAAWTTAT